MLAKLRTKPPIQQRLPGDVATARMLHRAVTVAAPDSLRGTEEESHLISPKPSRVHKSAGAVTRPSVHPNFISDGEESDAPCQILIQVCVVSGTGTVPEVTGWLTERGESDRLYCYGKLIYTLRCVHWGFEVVEFRRSCQLLARACSNEVKRALMSINAR